MSQNHVTGGRRYFPTARTTKGRAVRADEFKELKDAVLVVQQKLKEKDEKGG